MMPTGLRRRRSLAAALLLLASACVDRNPMSPEGTLPAPEPLATIQCQVTVATGRMSCAQQAPATGGARANIIGGQEIYVKLTSSGTSYDSGTGILSSTVTVQNLLEQNLGVDSLDNMAGIKVFFDAGPVLTSGTGDVSVANADSTDSFTTGMQPYFHYEETLEPFQISSGKLWQFKVDPTVETFSFTLLVQAPVSYGDSSDRGVVWEGDVDSVWTTAGNWVGDSLPNANSVVTIPPADSVDNMPWLTDSATVKALHVGRGSTLTLGGYTLTASANVDAVGTIVGGTVRMTGAGALLQGNVDALVLTGGSTTLQGATKATGAVSIQDAPLTLNGNALSISVP
jgi:hypothetical protein